MLTLEEALVLVRCRGPLEVFSPLCQHSGKLETWGSSKPQRMLSELSAKLLGLLITSWCILIG